MCQTNGIHPHIKHDTSIFLVMHRIKSITHFHPLLMTAYTMQRQMFSIQEKTFIGIRDVITYP